MNYIGFKEQNLARGCFSTHGLGASSPAALSSNLTRWTHEGRLIKLRSGWYTFPERTVSFADRMFCANNIYAPSYVSLFTALAYYEMIPESVTAITSISTLKTKSFQSEAGQFDYYTVKPSLFTGYKAIVDRQSLPYLIATPEKAVLDLLYLHPEYDSLADAEDLRLDEDFMHEEFDWQQAWKMVSDWNSKAMTSRFSVIEHLYR